MNQTPACSLRRWAFLATALAGLLAVNLPVRADEKSDSDHKSDCDRSDSDHDSRASGGGTAAYSGRALAFRVDGVQRPVAGPIVFGDTGELAVTGGFLEQHAANINLYNGDLTIDSVDATCTGIGPETVSETRLNHYHAHFVTHDGKDVFIDADFVGASASVSLGANGKADLDSSVTIQGLTVNGQAIAISGKANQVVDLPAAEVKLIINEQVSSCDKGTADFAVAAVHFYICECMEGHFGQVSAGITAKSTPPTPQADECGKVTGGGWINSSTGAKCTFGVSGGIRRGSFWGHLTYIDHGTGMKVESSAVTGFKQTDSETCTITYNVQINGVAGTATVQVSDKGEPGRNDTFAITLSTGYHAAGDLGGSHPGGGNIQVHKCPAGW